MLNEYEERYWEDSAEDLPDVLEKLLQDLKSLKPTMEIEELSKEEENYLENRPQSIKDKEEKIKKHLTPTEEVRAVGIMCPKCNHIICDEKYREKLENY